MHQLSSIEGTLNAESRTQRINSNFVLINKTMIYKPIQKSNILTYTIGK